MSARSKARKRALDLIFAAEARGQGASALLDEQAADGDVPANEYTVTLVRGVAEHATRLDELIAGYAQGWTLERMPAVDRNVLRLALFEILYVEDVPDPVAISEALALVSDLSTDESPAFVNGVLGNVLRDKADLTS
jgi:N utilization substance protein B